MKKLPQFISVLALMILVLTACESVSSAQGIPTIGPASTAQVAQTAIREAQVQSVEIQPKQTNPVQVNAIVRGNLTESCATFADTQLTYASQKFTIKLYTVSPSDRGCAPANTPFEQTIPLNSTDLQPGPYTVIANGVSTVFTLPAVTAAVVPSPTSEASQKKTFRSDTYHYQFSYPADWKIQVNTAVPSGAGSNPEYVTVTANGNLPQIAVEVLTGAPPMLGYEDCVKNFIFHDLPACQISLQAGQNPATELWIFQNGKANFYIAMAYQDKNSSMQQFNDFVSSFEFTQYDATPTVVPSPAPEAGCQDAARYISDDGMDGTTYAPNSPFTKTWTVKNTGSCTWDSTYLVSYMSGTTMTQQPGYWIVPAGQTVAPGQTVNISVGMTSPVADGNYRSNWGLKKENGQLLPIQGGANGNSFYVKIRVNNGSAAGEVTATSIDIVPEQGSGTACTADSTYFVHANITANGPTIASYEIGSTAGQIPAGNFQENGLTLFVSGTVAFDQADTKTINLRFVGPYPHPYDITVNLRVNGGEWLNTKLSCQ